MTANLPSSDWEYFYAAIPQHIARTIRMSPVRTIDRIANECGGSLSGFEPETQSILFKFPLCNETLKVAVCCPFEMFADLFILEGWLFRAINGAKVRSLVAYAEAIDVEKRRLQFSLNQRIEWSAAKKKRLEARYDEILAKSDSARDRLTALKGKTKKAKTDAETGMRLHARLSQIRNELKFLSEEIRSST